MSRSTAIATATKPVRSAGYNKLPLCPAVVAKCIEKAFEQKGNVHEMEKVLSIVAKE